MHRTDPKTKNNPEVINGAEVEKLWGKYWQVCKTSVGTSREVSASWTAQLLSQQDTVAHPTPRDEPLRGSHEVATLPD